MIDIKTILLASFSIVAPVAIFIFSGCIEPETCLESDGCGGDCEDYGGTFECRNDETGAICPDAEDPECNCGCVGPNDSRENNRSGNPGPRPTADDVPPPFRFVMLEDLSASGFGEAPGADIDAVAVCKANTECVAAQTVEDWETVFEGANVSADPTSLLGLPDSNCDSSATDTWYSMGGGHSYVILGFGGTTIENGDRVKVVELGDSWCPDSVPAMTDDHIEVGVSISTDSFSFIEIGECVGSCSLVATGLP